MEKVAILIVGTNKPIMKTIAKLIDRNEEWVATIAFSLVEAKEICSAKNFKMLLIGAGLEEFEEQALQEHLIENGFKIPMVKHYGGGSGLLYAEIYQALKTR